MNSQFICLLGYFCIKLKEKNLFINANTSINEWFIELFIGQVKT